MEFWNTVLDFVQQYQADILVAVSALAIMLLILALILMRRVGRLSKVGLGPVDGETGAQLRGELSQCVKSLSTVATGLEGLQKNHSDLKAQQEQCVQRIGFVRFDAFEDVGGEQSFALALLDAENNGVVISNLFSRVDSRMYAKRINGGKSEHNLSQEEREAVEKASRP